MVIFPRSRLNRSAVEMNYRELKDHLGLDHFEGRGGAGWHHHVTLVMVAFACVLSERLRRRKGVAKLTLPQVLGWLQQLLATWTGICLPCGQSFPRRPRDDLV